MPKEIVYKTGMTEFPDNCMACVMQHYALPMRCNSRGGLTDTIKNVYMKKRHPDCPLRKIDEVE